MEYRLESIQRTITMAALDACADAGFVLAGGSALREHGITQRPTQDVDLFTNQNDRVQFASAVKRTCAALSDIGLAVQIVRQNDDAAFLAITAHAGQRVGVDMARDWRAHERGVWLEIGPVLHKEIKS